MSYDTEKVSAARDRLKNLAQNMKNLADTAGDEVSLLMLTENGSGPVPLNEVFDAFWRECNGITTDLLLAYDRRGEDT